MTEFIVGTLIKLPESIEFTDDAGVATDPDTVIFTVERYSPPPPSAIQTYTYGTDAEVIKDATGTYHLEYLVAAQGTYLWRAAGTGAVQRAFEGWFTATTYFPPP